MWLPIVLPKENNPRHEPFRSLIADSAENVRNTWLRILYQV